MPVAAIMLVGASPEPFLSMSLECLTDAVDCLVINDNSGLGSHPNLEEIYRSKLYQAGKIQLIFSEFLGFGACRNLCMDRLRELHLTEDWWVMIVDSDEVHPAEKITPITRTLLPELGPEIGIVDGYFYDFFQSPFYYQAFNHRHNMLFRFRDNVHWLQAVHEQLVNLSGKRLVLPYCFFHYGYMKGIETIQEKWRFYGRLGDDISGSQAEQMDATVSYVAKHCWRYYGLHPREFNQYWQGLHTNINKHIENSSFVKMTASQSLLSARSTAKHYQIKIKMFYLYWIMFLRYLNKSSIQKGLGLIR